MSDYIRREDAIKIINSGISIDTDADKRYVNGLFMAIRPADVAPVRHGWWVEDKIQNHVEKTFHCSECDFQAWGEDEKTHYCGNCGARMEVTTMRLIDADALKPLLREYCVDGDEVVMKWYDIMGIDDVVDRAPTIDAVPVVRCKDCKCWTEWANNTGSCSRFALDWIGTDADDFCSMGEWEDDEGYEELHGKCAEKTNQGYRSKRV